MKDNRKKQSTLHPRVVEFIEECEKDNIEVTILKDYALRTKLELLFEDGLLIKQFELDHHIVNSKEYYKGFFAKFVKMHRDYENKQGGIQK